MLTASVVELFVSKSVPSTDTFKCIFHELKKNLEERLNISEEDLPIVQRFITSLDLDYFHYFAI